MVVKKIQSSVVGHHFNSRANFYGFLGCWTFRRTLVLIVPSTNHRKYIAFNECLSLHLSLSLTLSLVVIKLYETQLNSVVVVFVSFLCFLFCFLLIFFLVFCFCLFDYVLSVYLTIIVVIYLAWNHLFACHQKISWLFSLG